MMNFGKRQTKQRIKSANSNSAKYTTKLLYSVFKIIFICFIMISAVGGSVGAGVLMGVLDGAPNIEDTSVVMPDKYATTIYDSAGNLTQTLVMTGSNRYDATYDEFPEHLVNAFIAIEDARFWTNNGIDPRSILRAVKGILTDEYSGGGSTITQQLLKNNVFDGGMETSIGAKVERKLQEQFLAIQLTKNMSKELIMTNYLNTINLGKNTLGVRAAAKRYFNKDVSDLTLSESAVIAGITQSPSNLNPITGKEKNESRRKIILEYMYDQKMITKEQQEEALADDVYSRIQNVDLVTKESSSIYSYFTDELIGQVMEALQKQKGYTSTQAHNQLYSGGLQIITTQDPGIQAVVDEEVNNPENYSSARRSIEYRLSVTHADGTTKHYSEENIKSWHKNVLNHDSSRYDGLYNSEEAVNADIAAYKEYLLKENDTIIGENLKISLQPQASFVIMDQSTGHVKAITGGRGEKTANLVLNRATNTLRQPGSTFKVITSFAPAIDTCGATLGTVYYDSVFTVGTKTFKNWYGENRGYLGYSNIREGIIYSMNIIAVRCMMETVTPQLGVEYAENFGISSMTSTDLNASTALGGITDGVSNLELTGAFAAIANNGVYTKPVFFTKILDRNGKVLIDNEPETRRVIKDSTAFLLTDAMKASMKSGKKYATAQIILNPTSISASIPNMSVAGKSGTTSNNRDIWFVGYTPYYTAGIWGGCDNNQVLNAQNGGTSFHKLIWKKIMSRLHDGLSDPGFQIPDSVETAEICRKSGKLAVTGVCSSDPRGSAVYTEYFAKGTIPTEVCDHHVRVTVCSASGGLPSRYCPSVSRSSRVTMILPQDEEGSTDDSRYAMPGYCNVHTDYSAPSYGDEQNGADMPILPGENNTSETPTPPLTPSGPGGGPGSQPIVIPTRP